MILWWLESSYFDVLKTLIFWVRSWNSKLNFGSLQTWGCGGQRLWRTACVIYVTINWWNSNAHCCWICSFRKISKIIDPSIPQNHLKTDISMWDTLYLIEKNFWNIRLKPRICKNFEITKTVYVFKQNKMLFQHVPGDFFDLIHKYMRTIIIPNE